MPESVKERPAGPEDGRPDGTGAEASEAPAETAPAAPQGTPEPAGGPSPAEAGEAARASAPDLAETIGEGARTGADMDQEEIDRLLSHVGGDEAALEGWMPAGGGVDTAAPPPGAPEMNLDLLKDVTLRVQVELGRGRMLLRDILRLAPGSVVELDKLAGDPLDIYANGRRIGRGEVLVLNENFCVRITEIFSPEEEGA